MSLHDESEEVEAHESSVRFESFHGKRTLANKITTAELNHGSEFCHAFPGRVEQLP